MYEASVVYDAPFTNGTTTYTWTFTTIEYNNFLSVSQSAETLNLNSGVTYTLYFDSPVDVSQLAISDTLSYSTTKYTQSSSIEVVFIVSMTYLVTITGESGNIFRLNNNSIDNGNMYVDLVIE